MKRFSAVCAAVFGLCTVIMALPGCSGSSAPQIKAQSDGTLAISKDGQYLYTANADDDTVTVVDPFTFSVVASITVGEQPARIAVGPDDTIYVTNQGSRSVSVIHRGNWTVASTIAVGAGPVGLAISSDGTTLYVVNSAAATLQAIDLGSGNAQRWQTSLASEPRAVAVLPDGRLYVTHLKNGTVDILDGQSGNILGGVSTAVGVNPASAAGSIGNVTSLPAFRPVGLDSVVVSHDGTRAYFVHRRDRTGLLAGTLTTPVVVPGITTVMLATDLARDDSTDPTKDFPPPVIFPGPSGSASSDGNNGGNGALPTTGILCNEGNGGSTSSTGGGPVGGSDCIGSDCGSSAGSGGNGSSAYGVQSGGGCGSTVIALPWTQGPVAAIEDPTGQFIYVANLNSDNITVISTTTRTATGTQNGVMQEVPVGTAPSGLALSMDGKTLFVHNSLDHSVSFLQSSQNCANSTNGNAENNGSGSGNAGSICEINRVTVGTTGSMDPVAVAGRLLFFSATNSAMTVPGGGIACESCHLASSSDGNVWQFPFGPRKTPNLLGRKTEDTAPYHWDGTEMGFTDFFAETIQMRMGGQGLQTSNDPTQDQPTQIETYLQDLQAPDNPFIQPGGLTTSQAAGKALFAGKAGCIACHTGENFTDNSFHDVGSFVSVNPNGAPDDLCRLTPGMGPCIGTDGPNTTASANPANTVHGYNTPSLLGVVWAAPYLHSGMAATLTDRLMDNPGDAHGTTSTLSSDEIDDLVQYLQTL
jgi:YVTN family beta-propeller protein